MGQLVDGVWRDEWYDTAATKSAFVRKESAFRDWVSDDGSTAHPVEEGRYHLYVAYACPWAHRTLIMRQLKGLTSVIPISVVDPDMLSEGWTFGGETDVLLGVRRLYEVYLKADPHFSGRVTVPVLWDKQAATIVNNESSEIIRMMNGPLARLGDPATPEHDYYPPSLREDIDAINAVIYDTVNNGVYKAGFATAQAAYDTAYAALFQTLDMLEDRLSGRRYLVGGQLSEADIRLFTTLVRFDAVYFAHFKCNRQHLYEFTNLWGYLRDINQVPGIAETVRLDQIKRHYYASQRTINPTGIVPLGPTLSFAGAHGREALS
jgi:putative glutathione S-transferase